MKSDGRNFEYITLNLTPPSSVVVKGLESRAAN